MTIYVWTLKDLLGDARYCEIINPYNREVVRRIRRQGNNLVELDAITAKVMLPLNTEVRFEPWVFDRGNLLISVPGYGDKAKLCTEADIVRYEDGTEACIMPGVANN